ncbi:hypothetical protein [Synechococcus lacustris]|uniref:Uncharacterized protein n=1 Tax=Synechococcus lacustris str. Tous TaxID=1910958 RepID=A0A2P7EB83_9SYNE|nr:hypothetical protein [Synechococcus lacustris]PSI00482.1 hypothetical protein C7K08_12915 [Synechococcus lacustris str. Tous]
MTIRFRPFLLAPSVVALSIFSASAHAQATDYPNSCSFNGTWENCRLTGEGQSINVTYAKDGKKIELEMVGNDWECSKKNEPSNSRRCGKILITERKEGRTTWGTYMVTRMSSGFAVRSSRGNTYYFEK